MFRLSLAIYVVAVIVLVLQCAPPGQAAAIGRILNKDHDAVFAEQKKALARAKERKPFLACPTGHVPCLASAEGETVADDVYECVDVSTSLQSCGGCSLRRSRDGEIEQGDGTDCTLLAHVKSVECQASQCHITSCRAGFQQTSLGCV